LQINNYLIEFENDFWKQFDTFQSRNIYILIDFFIRFIKCFEPGVIGYVEDCNNNLPNFDITTLFLFMAFMKNSLMTKLQRFNQLHFR